MTLKRRFGPSVETALVLGLGLAAIYLSLLPFSLAPDRSPTPDLVFCLVAAWVLRRPAAAPLWAILALGLAADVLLSRPIGLGALGLLLVSEVLRASAASIGARQFAAEWLTVAILGFAALLGGYAALQVTFAESPGLGPLLRHGLATAVAYPVVVALVSAGVGLRAARRRSADRLGRLA